jgi:hypothetical protein
MSPIVSRVIKRGFSTLRKSYIADINVQSLLNGHIIWSLLFVLMHVLHDSSMKYRVETRSPNLITEYLYAHTSYIFMNMCNCIFPSKAKLFRQHIFVVHAGVSKGSRQ